jgi:adenylate cyclase
MANPSTRLLSAATSRRGLLAGIVAFLILMVGFEWTGALRVAENWAQDKLRVQLAEPLDPRLELVYLDDVSLRSMEDQFQIKYPWPREIHAATVDVLRQAGAKAIIYDFLFTSGSSYGEDDDKAFAKAMKAHGKVVIGMQVTGSDQPEARGAFMQLPPLHRLPAAGPLWDVARGVDHPHEPLWSAAYGVGDTNFDQDSDGLGRKTRLAVSLEDQGFPSLAYAAALAVGVQPALTPLGKQDLLFRQPPKADQVSNLFDITASKAKLDAGAQPLIDLSRFKDKIVLIGSSAPGLKDLRPTPMGKDLPGVFVQAVALDNLLRGERLEPLRQGRFLRFLVLLLLCVGVAMLSFRLRGPLIILPSAVLIALIVASSRWAYQAQHVLLPIAHWCAAVILGFSHGAVEYFVLEQRERKKVQAAFGQFLSPAVLASLRAKGDKLEMGGETRTLTVFFSDLQGFTNFSEKLSPHDLVLILNEYLDEMVNVVVGQHDATVDKYIGDAIMAFWNAPADQADHALRGCRAAWHCQVKLAQIQESLKAKGLDAGDEGLVMRIGLNTGPAVAGLMGSQRKLNYTVMGDTVNTASRLEGANKPYGSRIMIAEATKEAAGPTVITRPLDYIKVKGKADATAVFEVIGLEGEEGRLYPATYVERWSAALAAYKDGDFQGALSGFQGCQKQQPKDKACALFIDRCEHYLAEPPSNWDGVYTMKTK